MAPPRSARPGYLLVATNMQASNHQRRVEETAILFKRGDIPSPDLLFAREWRCTLFFSASSSPAPSSRILFLARGECSLRTLSPSIFLFFGVVGSPKAACSD